MSIIRLFTENQLNTGKTVTLSPKQTHYLKNVMRAKEGNNILLFNGKDGEYKAAIQKITKKECSLTINSQTRKQNEENLKDTELIFTPLKQNKQSMLIEKATELGVSSLQPITTEYTAIKKINLERNQNIVIEAAEQCERLSIPTIKPIKKLKEITLSWDKAKKQLFYLDERKGKGRKVKELKTDKNKPASFIIGPEGGFSEKEFRMLEKSGAMGIDLGSLILRAETAGIAILAAWNNI